MLATERANCRQTGRDVAAADKGPMPRAVPAGLARRCRGQIPCPGPEESRCGSRRHRGRDGRHRALPGPGSAPIAAATPTLGASRGGVSYALQLPVTCLPQVGPGWLWWAGDRGAAGPARPGCAGTVPQARPKPGVSSGRGWFWFSSRRRALHSTSRGNRATLLHPCNQECHLSFLFLSRRLHVFPWKFMQQRFVGFSYLLSSLPFFFPSCIFACKIMLLARLWVLHLMCKLPFLSLFL